MKTNPITPPPELLDEWCMDPTLSNWRDIATKAAQWGADQELEACCEWIPELTPWDAEQLRAARRPKPQSLKEQALEVVTGLEKRWDLQCDLTLLRRALEALPE